MKRDTEDASGDAVVNEVESKSRLKRLRHQSCTKSRRQIVFDWVMGEEAGGPNAGWWGTSEAVAHVDELLAALDKCVHQVGNKEEEFDYKAAYEELAIKYEKLQYDLQEAEERVQYWRECY